MDIFQAHYADIRDPAQQLSITARLRDQGLVTFDGLGDRAALVALARRLMTIRPHRDADPDGITVITGTGARTSGYAAFTDAELIPHTDGSSMPDPPGPCDRWPRPGPPTSGQQAATSARSASRLGPGGQASGSGSTT